MTELLYGVGFIAGVLITILAAGAMLAALAHHRR